MKSVENVMFQPFQRERGERFKSPEKEKLDGGSAADRGNESFNRVPDHNRVKANDLFLSLCSLCVLSIRFSTHSICDKCAKLISNNRKIYNNFKMQQPRLNN